MANPYRERSKPQKYDFSFACRPAAIPGVYGNCQIRIGQNRVCKRIFSWESGVKRENTAVFRFEQLFIQSIPLLRSILYSSIFALLVLSCQQDTIRRTDFLIQGIDVSRYQLQVDWTEVAKQGIHFAFVKATEGATHLDTLFHKNWHAIKASGLKRGAYHFFRPQTDARQQAAYFLGQVELEDGDLPPVLDIEVLDRIDPRALVADLHTWLSTVYDHFGVRPVLYTNLKFYNRYLAGHFDDYPLWIARYNEEEPVLACGRDWQFWQYGNRGKLVGIDGYVDFNVFYGDWLALDSLTYSHSTALSFK